MYDVAVTVAQHLNLDMARPLDEFLHVDGRISKGCLRFGRRSFERAGKVSFAAHDAHAAATPAGARLDDHWKAVPACKIARDRSALDAA